MKNLKSLPILILLISLLLWQEGIAQTAAKGTKSAKSQPQLENSLLWKIEGKGIKTSYLYGTMHLLAQEDFNLTDKTLNAFKSAEQIVMELDMDNPSLQMEIMNHVQMKDGTTLDQLLDEESYKKLDESLKASYGVGVQIFNNWTPTMVGTLLLTNFIEGKPASFEGTFVQHAADQQKELLGLETVEEQLALFHQTPYKDQVKDLKEMLNEQAKVQAMFDAMTELYKKEDIEGLYVYTQDYYDNPQMVELMLHARNKNWIAEIEEYAKNKSTFFAVGAGHLGGASGVIHLLKEQGYTVSPVK